MPTSDDKEKLLAPFLNQLKNFDKSELQAIIDYTEIANFKKGDLILMPGKVSDSCYFVFQGCLRQYQIIDGEEKTTGFFLEGQPAISYSSYLNKIPSEYYISCVEDCILMAGSREQELAMITQYPKLGALTPTLMLQDYERASDYITMLNSYKPEDRYLMLLKNQPELLNRVPLYHIASFLGVTPESFSRIRKRITMK